MTRRITVRGVVFSALFAALLSVSSLFNVTLGFTPVPISLETLVVMLAGALLGPVYGFFSMFFLIALAALGLPLFHGAGGMALILGPTGGFIWMYPVAALLIGLGVSRIKGKSVGAFVGTFVILEVCGSLLLYVTGVPWLAHVAGLSMGKAMALGFYPYLLGDAIKAFLGAWIVLPVRQVWPVRRILGQQTALVAKLDWSESNE